MAGHANLATTTMPHGYGRYTIGCRCDTCTAAKRQYVADLRARRLGEPVPAHVQHGKRTTYEHWGCRCAACVQAKRDAARVYDHAHRRASRGVE
jgi:hypothetical protein